jgi:Glycosyl transferase family 2
MSEQRFSLLSLLAATKESASRAVSSRRSRWNQLHGSVEIIYVDSASADDSVERALRFGAKVVQVKPVRPCASIGLNAGWRAAHGAIVLFLDGDTILTPGFVKYAWKQFDAPDVAVVFGDRREIDTQGSVYNRVLDLDWIPVPGAVQLCGGDALIRRDVLERVNGYDERLIAGEDAELCSRILAQGFGIIHLDCYMIGHDLGIHRFSQYWRRSVRTGHAYAEISERLRNDAIPIWLNEARRNRVRGAAMIALLVGAPILSLAIRSVLPTIIMAAIVLALALRTAHRARWKCSDGGTRLLYGLHSQLGHVPILLGQLKYYLDRLSGRTARLIEYKEVITGSTNAAGETGR